MSADIIDTNVVEMRFDNEQFVKNVSQTIDVVDQLKNSLEFDSHSFDSLTRAANNIDLSRIATGVEALSDRFSGLGIVGMTAIQRITNEVMTLGGKLAKLVAKPWQQIITGGTNRASNIEQARFQLKGLYGDTAEGAAKLAMTMDATAAQIQQITGYTEDMVVAMDAANYAVADTAYGLDSAAKAASVLATSGIDVMNFSEDLKDASGMMRTEMQVALRAISGSAAMANASYDEMAHTFERVAGNGRVMAIDLQSFSARGLNAAATIRDYLNEIGETANATEADIREMVSDGKINFMTLANAMDSAYGDHAKDANNTFTGALSNMKFGLSKIGADFIAPLRQKMIPLFNDLRLSINNVRKALNFKMKFPGLEEEVSVVDLFTNAVTNLSNKLHELFAIWMGGQDIATKAMTGLSEAMGVEYTAIKDIFDDAKNGTKSVKDAIEALRNISSDSGDTVNKVLEQLAENLDKTDSEIQRMCENGEVSFEDLSNAASAAFGNARWDSRVQQLATIFQNLVKSAVNVGDAIGSVVAPIVKAFFDVFRGNGVRGIIGTTSALVEFTDKLRLSRKSMDAVYRVGTAMAKSLKTIIKIILRVASSIFKVIEAMSPLLAFTLNLVAVLADIVSALIDVATESQLLQSIAVVLVNILSSAARVLVVVLVTILSILTPAIKMMGQFFAAIARGIGTIDLSFLNAIAEGFESLVNAIASGSVISKVRNALIYFFTALSSFFAGVGLAFTDFNSVMDTVTAIIQAKCGKIVEFFTGLAAKIKGVFSAIFAFFSDMDNVKAVIAIIEEVIAFGALTGMLRVGGSIAKAIRAFARKEDAEALYNVALAIKNVAQAFLILAAALIVFSLVPEEKVWSVCKLAISVSVLLGILAVALIGVRKLVAQISDSKGGALEILSNGVSKFLGRLGKGLQSFLKNAGKAAVLIGLASLLLSVAGAIFILYKAISGFAAMTDDDKIKGGITALIALGAVLASIILVCVVLKGATAGVGVALFGAATAILAMVIAVKVLQGAIQQFADMDVFDFARGWGEVTLSLIALSVAIGIIARSCKQSGTAMMQTAIVMLGFIVVLKAMKGIIEEFASLNVIEFVWGLISVSLVLNVLAGAIERFSQALGDSTKSFSASLKDGISYQSATQKFMGMLLVMLGLVVVLKSIVSVMKEINQIGFAGWAGGMILLVGTIREIANLLDSMKNVTNARAIQGVAAMIFAIALTLLPLTLMDTGSMLVAALSVCSILWTVSKTINDIASFANGEKLVFKTLVAMASVISTVGVILLGIVYLGGSMDQVLSIALSISIIMIAIANSLSSLNGVKFNAQAIFEMVTVIAALGLVVSALTLVKVDDIPSLMAIVTAVSILGLIMAGIVKLISGVIFSGDPKQIFAVMTSITVSLGLMMIALGTAGKIFSGNASDLIALSASMILLIPVIVVMVQLANMLSSASSNLMKGILGVGAIIGIISVFTLIIAAIAQLGDVTKTIALLNTVGLAMLALIPFIAIMAVVSTVLGAVMTSGIGAAAFFLGFAGLTMIIGLIGGFVAAVAAIANFIGDANSTVLLLTNLGSAMTAMIPFIITMEILCTVLGAATPLMLAGIGGFTVLSLVILAFVAAIAGIAMMGDVNNTVYLLNGLVIAMNEFKGFLTQFMVVLALVGAVSPLALAGTLVLNQLLNSIVNFVMQIVSLSSVVDPEIIKSTLNAVIDSISALLPLFAGILAAGVMAPQITAASVLISVALLNVFALLATISAYNTISSLAIKTMDSIEEVVNSIIRISDLMLHIGLNGILMLDAALRILSMSVLTKMMKLTIFTTGFLGISAPLIAISKLDDDIESGLSTALNMMEKLYSISTLSARINKLGVIGIQAVAEEMLKLADTVMVYCGEYAALGFAHGVIDSTSISALEASAKLMGAAFENSFRDYMGIHSDSRLMIWLSQFASSGWLTGTKLHLEPVKESGTIFGNTFGTSAATSLFSQGELGADSYLSGFLGELGSYDLDSIFGESTGLKKKNNNVLRRGYYDMNTHRFIHRGTSYGDNSPTNPGNRPYYSPAVSDIEAKEATGDYDDLNHIVSNLLKNMEGLINTDDLLGSSFDSTSLSAGGLSDSLGGAGKSANELADKLDDLMERYEKRFDTAKERANKDLFKGVDDQGDDFLDKVKDIMDEYEDIFTSAVERTNNQDLFAEIKEDDESFAPETLLNNLEDQVNQINELNTIISSLSGRIADKNLAAAIANMDVDDLPQLRALYRMNAGQLSEYEQMYQRKVQANQNKIQNELSGQLSQLTGSTVDVATYVATDASTTRLIHNLEAQVNQLNVYNDTVASLMNRIKDVHLREAIATMGVESIEELKALNSMTDAQLDEYVALYNNKINAGMTSVTNELSAELSELLGQPLDISAFYEQYEAGLYEVADKINAGSDGAKAIGSSTGSQIANEMSNAVLDEVNADDAYSSGKGYTESIAAGLKDPDALDLLMSNLKFVAYLIVEDLNDNYTQEFVDTGSMIVRCIMDGIEQAKDAGFDECIDGIGQRIIDKIESKHDQFVLAGKNIVNGVKEGMLDPTVLKRVDAAAYAVAYRALKKIRETLKEHSPSRATWEFGKFLDLGFANGIRDYSKSVENEAGNMAEGSLSTVQEAINQLSGMLDGSIDVNPTITPTLDLSAVNARSAALESMFSNRRIAVQAQNAEQQAEMMSKLGDVIAEQNSEPRSITFNQTNNSPKALSRQEIYRQSRNAFSQLVSAVT
jgi:hypothetical protein